MQRTLTLEELKQQSLEDLLHEIVMQGTIIVVRLPEGGEIVMGPKQPLEPLPVLDGYVPEGWKDAIYSC
jgi:hypothetical protein